MTDMGKEQSLIVRGGECGELIRTIDWPNTDLGPVESWSAELRSIVNTILNTPLAIVLITNIGGYLIYNDAYAEFAGPKHPQILGQNYALAWPEIADYNRDIFERVNDGEVIEYKEMLLQLRRDQKMEDVYLDLQYSPIFDADGSTIATMVTVIDVTSTIASRQAAETAVTEANRQRQVAEDASLLNQAITENASTAMFIMDSNFHCTFMNPAAVAMTGYTMQDMRASKKTLHQMIHYAHADGSTYKHNDCPINESVSRLQMTSGDELFFRKDGSSFPVYFVASPIIQQGTLTSIILEVRDMTETEQLTELNRAKDDFIAMASHQLRTPATSVKQYLGIVMQEYAGPVNETQLQYLQTAYDANERQLTIVDDLLKTAKVDTRGFRLKLRSGNVSNVVRQSLKACDAVFETRRQSLVVHIPDKPIAVRFDKNELHICIDNLLENASKYSPAGSVITVRVKDGEDYVTISVQDQGVGIAPGNVQKIFEKFTRVSNELSDTVSGNGLGLYWVKRVVDLHKGTVTLKSKLGSGTTFTIQLPK